MLVELADESPYYTRNAGAAITDYIANVERLAAGSKAQFRAVRIWRYTDLFEQACAALTIDDLTNGQQASQITSNLTLPTTLEDEGGTINISWSSSQAGVISNTGVVARPAVDTDVTLTATFTRGSDRTTRTFNFRVLAEEGGGEIEAEWNLLQNITFDSLESATVNAGAASAALNDEGYLTISNNTDTALSGDSATVSFGISPVLDNGIYYIEFEYEENLTAGQLWQSIRQESTEGITFTNTASAISLALRTQQDVDNGTGTGGWVNGPSGHQHGAVEQLGFLYNSQDDSVEVYLNRQLAAGIGPYFTRRAVDMLSQYYCIFQNVGAGSSFTYRQFNVWQMDTAAFDEDCDALTAEGLLAAGDTVDAVTQNLTLPSSMPNGSRVVWNSSAPSVIDPMTGAVTPQDVNTTVTLTATLSYGSLVQTKEFTFTVLSSDWEHQLFIMEDPLDTQDQWEIVTAGGEAVSENGYLRLQRRNLPDQELSATAYFASADADDLFRVTGESLVFQMQMGINANMERSTAVLYDSEGNAAAEIILTGTGTPQLELVYGSGGQQTSYIEAYTPGAGENVILSEFRFTINTETGALQVSVDGAEKVNGQLLPGAQDISYVTVDTGVSAYGILLLDDVYLSSESDDPAHNAAELDAANLTFEKISGSAGNRQDAVVSDLALLTAGYLGSTITWASDHPEIIGAAGSVTRPTTDTPVSLTAAVTVGSASVNVPFSLTVLGRSEENLAYGATVSASSGQDSASYAVDSAPLTGWMPSRQNATLTVDLRTAQPISRAVLSEYSSTGQPLVTGFELQVSSDGSNWTTVYTGTTVGDSLTADFAPVNARYVRYVVTGQGEGTTGLYELELYFDPSDRDRVQADRDALTWDEYIISGPVDLPGQGTFGSSITWSSSEPDILSDDGQDFNRPSSDTRFVMTATITMGSASVTKEFQKLAEGSGSSIRPGGGSGSSGGGSSVSGSGGLASVTNGGTTEQPNNPDDTQDTEQIFADVASDRWSYPYITALAEQGVVNGYDGLFHPEDSVTREEFLKMLLSVINISTDSTGQTPFADVQADAWYAPFVAGAYEAGIVQGISADTFGIGQPISRQDMAVMVVRALETAGITLETDGQAVSFADAEQISGYAQSAVVRLSEAGILGGNENGEFLPLNQLSREEAAKVVYLVGGTENDQ